MNIEHALLQAIHDDPRDEVSWQALADWLEEQNQSTRAELLRLHRQLRAYPEGPDLSRSEDRIHKLLLSGVVPYVPVLTNSIGMRLVLIPPGTSCVGSPNNEEGRYSDEARHIVTFTRPFYLGMFPVTQAEYQRLQGQNPSAHSATGRLSEKVSGLDTARFPVEEVTWHDATAYCVALSRLPAEVEAGRVYRLPTEVEWEFACRGGASITSPFPWGTRMTLKFANFKDRPRKPTRNWLGRPCEVGRHLPNAFGLYDMLGNVWEWCGDWYEADAYAEMSRIDPTGPKDGDRRNARGGTFNLEMRRVRSADRSSFDPEYRDCDCGFRVLCEWRSPGAKGT